jgi:membrane protease YdiL (CAAX protease family)
MHLGAVYIDEMRLVRKIIGSGAMFQLCAALGLNSAPPFARNVQPLTSDRLWLLGLWAAYWPINIFGENLVWRGILLPWEE